MKKMSFDLSEEAYQELKAVADKEDRSVAWIIRKAIQDYIDKNKGE